MKNFTFFGNDRNRLPKTDDFSVGNCLVKSLFNSLLICTDIALLFWAVDFFGQFRGFMLVMALNVIIINGWHEWEDSLVSHLRGVFLLLLVCSVSTVVLWGVGYAFNYVFSIPESGFELTLIEGAILYALGTCLFLSTSTHCCS